MFPLIRSPDLSLLSVMWKCVGALTGHTGVFAVLPVQVYIAAGQSYELESKLRRLEQSAKNRFGGTTDSELSELEDVVALTAARVQSAESEVGGDPHLHQVIRTE